MPKMLKPHLPTGSHQSPTAITQFSCCCQTGPTEINWGKAASLVAP